MGLESLNQPKLSAILAGLHLLQNETGSLPCGIDEIATCGNEHPPLEDEAIDELCERINTEGLTFGDS